MPTELLWLVTPVLIAPHLIDLIYVYFHVISIEMLAVAVTEGQGVQLTVSRPTDTVRSHILFIT